MTATFIALKSHHTSEDADRHDTLYPITNEQPMKNSCELSQEDFQHLNEKLSNYFEEQKTHNPLTKRERKDSKLILEDLLLLTLYELRHYPPLISLGAVFGISGSYRHSAYS
ncbi:MAG: hypothetical protein ACXWE3_02785 [Methylobacter sp.]